MVPRPRWWVARVITGGSLSRPAGLRFRHGRAVGLALVAQVVDIEVVPGENARVLGAVHPATYVAAGVHLKPGESADSGVLAHPRLAFLGDVLVVLGVGWGAHRARGSRLTAWPAPRRADRAVPSGTLGA